MEKKKIGQALALALVPAVAAHGHVSGAGPVNNLGDLPAAAITDTLIYVTTSASSTYVVNTILGDLHRLPQPMDVRPVPTDLVQGTNQLPQNVVALKYPVVFSTTKKST